METIKFFILTIFLIFFNLKYLYSQPINGKLVSLQILDKVTSRLENIEVKVGEYIIFDSLQIEIIMCKKRPPEEIPENFVLMRINDKISNENLKKVFQGWMISSSPSVTPFEHPIYDIWVKDCKIDID